MQICNSCDWTGKKQDCEKTEFLESLCPDCNAITTEGKGHEYDDEGICKKCNLDGAEASYYSQRGYAHEYPTLHNCPGKRS